MKKRKKKKKQARSYAPFERKDREDFRKLNSVSCVYLYRQYEKKCMQELRVIDTPFPKGEKKKEIRKQKKMKKVKNCFD